MEFTKEKSRPPRLGDNDNKIMQYALLNGQRSRARKGPRGTCPDCKRTMVAKCGPRVIHHWAHASRRNCDPWWENETAWHREWKEWFPEECREVSHTAPDGEVHRADIKTPTGIVIEVQHSTMTDDERESRESFYGNLVWILDGRSFRKSFHLGCMLPDPSAKWVQDVVWNQRARSAYKHSRDPIEDSIPSFWRISDLTKEYPGLTKANMRDRLPARIIVRMYFQADIEDKVRADYRGHHQFYWTRPRRTWYDANCPVYIDFGGDVLYRLQTYDETGRRCVYLVAKQKLIHDVMVERIAGDIATRFYRIPATTGQPSSF